MISLGASLISKLFNIQLVKYLQDLQWTSNSWLVHLDQGFCSFLLLLRLFQVRNVAQKKNCGSVIEFLPIFQESLGLIPSTKKKKIISTILYILRADRISNNKDNQKNYQKLFAFKENLLLCVLQHTHQSIFKILIYFR